VHSVTYGGIKFADDGDFREGEVPVLRLNGELNAGLYAINKVKILNCLGLWPTKAVWRGYVLQGTSANPWRLRSQV